MNIGAIELLVLLLALVLPALIGYGTAKVATNKGYTPFALWFVIGFFGGIIGLIVAAVLPRRQPPPGGPGQGPAPWDQQGQGWPQGGAGAPPPPPPWGSQG